MNALTCLFRAGVATEAHNPLATFKLVEPLSYGPHKLAAMVASYDGEVLASATVIFIYAPAELGENVPVPVPLAIPPRGSRAAGQGGGRRVRRLVRSILQHSGLDCSKRAQLVDAPASDSVIVDVGSHDGHELAALAAVARKVIAFEANPAKAAQIQELLKKQAIWHKVVLHAAAAGNISGVVPLHIPLGEVGSEMDSIGSTFYYTETRNSINVSPPPPVL